MELESSTAALRAFCQHCADPEHQKAFHALVDDFYQYNSEYLKTYRAFGEELELRAVQMGGSGMIDRWLEQGGALFQTSDETNRTSELPGDSRADDKTKAYLKNLSYLFDMIQKSGFRLNRHMGETGGGISQLSCQRNT